MQVLSKCIFSEGHTILQPKKKNACSRPRINSISNNLPFRQQSSYECLDVSKHQRARSHFSGSKDSDFQSPGKKPHQYEPKPPRYFINLDADVSSSDAVQHPKNLFHIDVKNVILQVQDPPNQIHPVHSQPKSDSSRRSSDPSMPMIPQRPVQRIEANQWQPNQRQLLVHNLIIGNNENDPMRGQSVSQPSEPLEEQKKESERILNLRVQNNLFASKNKQSDSQKSDTENDFNSDSLELEDNQSFS